MDFFIFVRRNIYGQSRFFDEINIFDVIKSNQNSYHEEPDLPVSPRFIFFELPNHKNAGNGLSHSARFVAAGGTDR